MQSEKNIIASLGQTIINNFSEPIADLSEIGLDQLINNELLKNIPIIKTVSAFCTTGIYLAEKHFLKETLVFISALNNATISEEKKQKYKKRFNECPKFAEKELERIIIILNSHIDIEKSKRLGKFYGACIEEKISWNQFCELSDANRRLFENDYYILKMTRNGKKCQDNYQAMRLAAVGLLKNTGPTMEDNSLIINESSYECTPLGQIFVDYS